MFHWDQNSCRDDKEMQPIVMGSLCHLCRIDDCVCPTSAQSKYNASFAEDQHSLCHLFFIKKRKLVDGMIKRKGFKGQLFMEKDVKVKSQPIWDHEIRAEHLLQNKIKVGPNIL